MTGFMLILLFLFCVQCGRCNVIIDCHPDNHVTVADCIKRGCYWKSPKENTSVPACSFPTKPLNRIVGYDMLKYEIQDKHLKVCLKRRPSPSLYGEDHEFVELLIESWDDFTLSVRFEPRLCADGSDILHLASINATIKFRTDGAHTEVSVKGSPFGVAVRRTENKQTLFDSTDLPGLTFARQFIQITSTVSTTNVYGFGQHYNRQLRASFQWNRLSLFSAGFKPHASMNLYGFQPFYMGLDGNHQAYGIFQNTTYGADFFLQPDPNLITYRVMGGNLHFIVFAGPQPDQVVGQYTKVIGRPMIPPFWGLGYQLSRFGYTNLTALRTVWDRNRIAKIPQDVQYIDADYMYNGMDFTLDEQRFNELPSFVKDSLHKSGRKLVLIVDPAIAVDETRPTTNNAYEPLEIGLEMDVFLKDNRSGRPLVGSLWPGDVYLPDFVTHPNASVWWRRCIRTFHRTVAFDGLWIDENEPTSFVDGSTTGCADNRLNNPLYSSVSYSPIFKHTICLDADHFRGKHYEHHNAYALHQAIHTTRALRHTMLGLRAFVLSRSSAPGIGAHAAVWMGDTYSTWESMDQSIIAMLDFNLFGIPWTGTDICGFEGEVSEELCVRWSQLGAFYPFSRNHNSNNAKTDQDPAAWSANTTEAIRNVLLLRYSLLPYLYTLFFTAHINGSAVVKPMFFEFVDDPTTHNMHDQFLWGGHLLIAPILQPFTVSRTVYFPKGRWYNVLDGLRPIDNPQMARWCRAEIPKDSIGLFLRGGGIIPWQTPSTSTPEQLNNSLGLSVALDSNGAGKGQLYWDDGITVQTIVNNNFCNAQFTAQYEQLKLELVQPGCVVLPVIAQIDIAGVESVIKSVTVNQVPWPTFSFSKRELVLRITNLSINLFREREVIVRWKA